MGNGQENGIGEKAIEMRLTAVKEAMQRSRFVFIVLTVASSAILFTLWNDRFSRDRTVALEPPGAYNEELQDKHAEPINIYGTKQLVGEWYRNRIIQVGILGIRVSVSDLAMMGSFTLVVITIWYYHSQRRENRATVTLLRDTQEESVEVRDMVCKVIKHSSVFIRTDEGDKPLEGLQPSQSEEGAEEKITRFLRSALRFLVFLPFWTIAAIIVRDIIVLFQYSPLSGPHEIFLNIIIKGLRKEGLSWDAVYPILYILIFDGIAFVCAYSTYKLCKRSHAFSDAIRTTLMEFEEKIKLDKAARPSEPTKPPPRPLS